MSDEPHITSMSDTEITRTIQVEDKTIHVHIHLTEDEVQRLLLPHIASAFTKYMKQAGYRTEIRSSSTMGSMPL